MMGSWFGCGTAVVEVLPVVQTDVSPVMISSSSSSTGSKSLLSVDVLLGSDSSCDTTVPITSRDVVNLTERIRALADEL